MRRSRSTWSGMRDAVCVRRDEREECVSVSLCPCPWLCCYFPPPPLFFSSPRFLYF